jgi:hypothetical protein
MVKSSFGLLTEWRGKMFPPNCPLPRGDGSNAFKRRVIFCREATTTIS